LIKSTRGLIKGIKERNFRNNKQKCLLYKIHLSTSTEDTNPKIRNESSRSWVHPITKTLSRFLLTQDKELIRVKTVQRKPCYGVGVFLFVMNLTFNSIFISWNSFWVNNSSYLERPTMHVRFIIEVLMGPLFLFLVLVTNEQWEKRNVGIRV